MYHGSCHCGQTRYTVEAGEIPAAIECNCSHCQRKGYLLWFVPRQALTITEGAAALSTYTFNKHVIQQARHPPPVLPYVRMRAVRLRPGAGWPGDGRDQPALPRRCRSWRDQAQTRRWTFALNAPAHPLQRMTP